MPVVCARTRITCLFFLISFPPNFDLADKWHKIKTESGESFLTHFSFPHGLTFSLLVNKGKEMGSISESTCVMNVQIVREC